MRKRPLLRLLLGQSLNLLGKDIQKPSTGGLEFLFSADAPLRALSPIQYGFIWVSIARAEIPVYSTSPPAPAAENTPSFNGY